MATFRKYLASKIAEFIPVVRRTIYNFRSAPSSIAADIDVDRVLDIVKSAENGNVEPLFSLYLETVATGSHLQGLIASRKEAVLSDTITVLPFDKDEPEDVKAADAIREEIISHDAFEDGCAHLLDSFLWPVSLLEKTYQPSAKPGLRYDLRELTVVPYQLLDYTEGRMQLRECDERGYPTSTRFDVDPARYIVHRGHLLKAMPDTWGGPMRSLLFWWLLSNMSRDWWARFLDRYGGAFMVGKYDQNDDDSRVILERAFQLSTKLGGLVVSKETQVEIQQAAASMTGDAYRTFIELCNREMSKLVLGETLSTDAQATGMNSGNAKLQGGKRDEKRAGDSRRLGRTLRNELFAQYLQINGFTGRPPRLVWGAASAEEAAALCDQLDALDRAGLEPDDDALEIISERMAMPIRRKAAPPAPEPGIMPFAADGRLKKKADGAVDATAEAAAADLAKAFRGELAPIREIILHSSSPEQAIEEVAAFCATRFKPDRTARVLEDAMAAIAANGSVVHAD